MKTEVLPITAIAYGGAGIGRLADGRVCFVPGSLPGEDVEVLITEEKKRFVRGQAVRILIPSPARVEIDCPCYGICPGCSYRHCRYEEELHWKDRQFRDFLLRNSLADESVFLPPFSGGETDFYRNKLTLHRNNDGSYGYYGSDNQTVFPVACCRLAKAELNDLIPGISGEEALLRYTSREGGRQIDRENPGVLHEELPGAGEFMVSGSGFFQTNLPVAAELVRRVKEFASGSKEILELYCGVGVFSIALAETFPALHCSGIELNKTAVEFAKRNAAAHCVADRCYFVAGDAGENLRKFRNHPGLTLLLDPPRSGVGKAALKNILELKAEKVIYISCAADTLARDLKEFVSAGYRISNAQVLDMFPRTAHFESLTVLEKEKI